MVAADGTFTIELVPAQTHGETVSVNLTDAAGNISESIAIQAPNISLTNSPTKP